MTQLEHLLSAQGGEAIMLQRLVRALERIADALEAQARAQAVQS